MKIHQRNMIPLSHIKAFGSYHGLKHVEYILEEMCPYQIECSGVQTVNRKRVTNTEIFV
jgi:hypothetical protein